MFASISLSMTQFRQKCDEFDENSWIFIGYSRVDVPAHKEKIPLTLSLKQRILKTIGALNYAYASIFRKSCPTCCLIEARALSRRAFSLPIPIERR
jgi:hypothetical protein